MTDAKPVKDDHDDEKIYSVMLDKPTTYMGTPIRRAAYVNLKGSVLKSEEVWPNVVSTEPVEEVDADAIVPVKAAVK